MLFSTDYTIPPALAGLTAIGGDSYIKLRWDTGSVLNEFWATEIWVSSINDRSTAVLATTERGSSYTYAIGPNITKYFWIRAKGLSNQTNGEWFPTSETDGCMGKSNPLQIRPIIGTTQVNLTGVRLVDLSCDMTEWEIFNDTGFYEFIAPDNALLTFEIGSYVETTCTLTTPGDQAYLIVSTYLWNHTDQEFMAGVSQSYLTAWYANENGITYRVLPHSASHMNVQYDSGPTGVLTAGHTYRIYLAYLKRQTVGTGGILTLDEGFQYWNFVDSATLNYEEIL